MIFAFDGTPSEIAKVYWSHTFEDLRRVVDLRIRFKMVKAMAFTESLLFTAGKIFGAKQSTSTNTQNLTSVDDMLAFARQINNG